MVRCLGELVRILRCRSPGLSVYQGEDWREYVRPNTRLTLFHDESMTLRLVSLTAASPVQHVIPTSEIRLLQGELRLLNSGERIREGQTHRLSDPAVVVCEKDSVHIEWEL